MFRGRWRFESLLKLPLMEPPRDWATLSLDRPMWNNNGESCYCPTRAHCRCCQSRMWHVVGLTITLCPPENNPMFNVGGLQENLVQALSKCGGVCNMTDFQLIWALQSAFSEIE